MTTILKILKDFRWVYIIRVYQERIELIMKSPKLDSLANIHAPAEVKKNLEDRWEYARTARSSNGKMERSIRMLYNRGSRGGQWAFTRFWVVN